MTHWHCMASSRYTRLLELEQDYKRLSIGPSTRQNIEAWLDDWIQMYTLGKEYGLAEIVDTKRAYRDFLFAIEEQEPILAQIHLYKLEDTDDKEELLFKVIERLRYWIQVREIQKPTAEADDQSAKQQYIPKCLCGRKHWFNDCWYLRQDKRPSNWKPDSTIQKKMEDKMKDDTIRAKVERSIAKNKRIEARKDKKSKRT
ncbi:MAG: hypothetical protein Q9181_003903 [Wetmoreana brouardii]